MTDSSLLDLKTYWRKNLFLPTPERPVRLMNTEFYPDHFIQEGKRYSYDEVVGVVNKVSNRYVNGLHAKKECEFLIYLEDKKIIPLLEESWFQFILKKKTEQTELMAYWLQDRTYRNRLEYALQELRLTGDYHYRKAVRITNTGGFYVKGDFIANLVEAYNSEGHLSYGEGYKSFIGRDLGQNAYAFKVKKQMGRDGLLGKDHVKFDIIYNRDVFDTILKKLLLDGKVVE